MRARATIAALVALAAFGVLVLVVVPAAPGVVAPDRELADVLHRPVLGHPALASTLRVVSALTQPNWARLTALLVAGWLWRGGERRTAGWLLLTMAGGGLLGIGLKQVFARSRPEWPEAITVASGYSFPSGHALNSMLAAGCAVVLLAPHLGFAGRRLLAAVAAAYVLLVGFDRVALGVHYLTDVLAGWALALAVLFTTLAVFTQETRPARST